VPSGQTTATLCYDADFYPFGAERTYTNTCSQNYKFTGKERDPESNLDDFGVRYYASNMGRFMSADSPFADQHPDEPQSWNLYSYATNNPLHYIDSNGRVKEDANGNVVFDKTSSGTFPFMNNAPVTLGNGQAGTITITWKADFGTIYADDGTKIQASKATSDMSVVVHDENGKVVQQGGSEVLGNGYSDSADCHGTTFANGQVWIDNDQVPALIKGDGYEQTTKPGPGDVGVFTKTGDLSTTVHSVKVDQVDSKTGKVEEVTSKGGITPKVETTPEKAWNDPAQLQYYKQPKKAVHPNPDYAGMSGGCYAEDEWY
jgi:RHS repeat-associated protein